MKTNVIVALAVLVVTAMTSQPAHADISAFYSAEVDELDLNFRMSVEVADNGSARIHVTGRSIYFLIVRDEVFLIERGIDGVYATRLSDLNLVMSESGSVAGMNLDFLTGGEQTGLINLGNQSVLGREGTGYAEPNYYDDDGQSPEPDLVISQADDLRPIGAAIAQSMDHRYGIARTMTLVSTMGPLFFYADETLALLNSGTPIKIGALLLSEVSTIDIDAARFELPERVVTLDELREMYRPFEWPTEFDWQPEG